jgi:hypothetical protein
MRPLWYEFPQNEATFDHQDSFLLGPALLVAPVLAPGVDHVDVLLPRCVGSGVVVCCVSYVWRWVCAVFCGMRVCEKGAGICIGMQLQHTHTLTHTLPTNPTITTHHNKPNQNSEAKWYESVGGGHMGADALLAGVDQTARVGVHADAIPSFFRGGYVVPRRCAGRGKGPCFKRRGPFALPACVGTTNTPHCETSHKTPSPNTPCFTTSYQQRPPAPLDGADGARPVHAHRGARR